MPTPAPIAELLRDSELITIREAVPSDVEAVRALYGRTSPRSLYLRYFGGGTNLDRAVGRLVRPADESHEVLVGLIDDVVVGVGEYDLLDDPTLAEVAFLVDDHLHHLGIATKLLDHLATEARRHGVRCFIAETLSENRAMIGVLDHCGYPTTSTRKGTVVEISVLILAPAERQLQALPPASAVRGPASPAGSTRSS